MTKPQRNHGTVNARLQKLHRSAVPQDVRGHSFGPQGRASLPGDLQMLGQQRLNAVGTEPAPVHVREQGTRSAPHGLLNPCLKGTSSARGERRASFLPTFADTSHVGTGTQMYGVQIETDQLGKAQACLRSEQ